MRETTQPRRFTKRFAAISAGLALVLTGAVGAQTFANEGEVDPGPLPPPGEPFNPEAPGDVGVGGDDPALGSDPLIQTSGSTFDETILTKYIPASAFDPLQGGAAALNDDLVLPDSLSCLRPDTSAGGENTFLKAPVELPDGARIKRITFYGEDSDPARDISIKLYRQEFTSGLAIFPFPPTVSRANTTIDSFSTSGNPGDTILSGADNLEELTGSPFTGPIFTFPNRFHTVEVVLQKSASTNHVLCGVVVQYQVAKSSADPGTVYHPLDPFRAFDSRLASFGALSGRLTPNATKVIDITDGYDSNGVAIPAQADLVPANATAITYNVTVAGQTGPNFVAVTPGDAASFTASAINYTGAGSIANGASVTLAPDQTIKVWGGDNTGSAHVIIDVTGFHAPAPPPSNMGN